jgi:RNA polymerase sigma-70 factor (ECF subfamily)
MSDPRTEPRDAPPYDPSSPTTPRVEDTVSDDMLLHGVRLRDETALALLHDRYGGLLFTLALRMVGDRDLAEEVAHDVFLRCWHGLEQYDAARSTLPVWLLGMARSRAIEVLHGRQIQSRPAEGEPRMEPGPPEPVRPARAEEAALHQEVAQALAELPESQRQAIELVYYGGRTQAEAAHQLDEPIGTVKTRVRDGLRRLRRVLAPIVEDSPRPAGGAS